MAWWSALAGQGAAQMGKLDDAITGRVMAGWADRRQVKQQKKLQALAIEGQKQMNKFDQELALEMWDKTNYAAQTEQMRKAGLNVGLMYEGGGMGGSTAGAGSGSPVKEASAPVGGDEMGMAMQTGVAGRLAAAQEQLMYSQAKNLDADTENKTGVDRDLKTNEIQEIIARTNNEKLKNEYQNYQNTIASVQAEIAQKSMDELLNQLANAGIKLAGEAQSAISDGQIKANTASNVIEQINMGTVEKQLSIASQKIGLKIDEANVKKITREILKMDTDFRKEWREWEQAEKERWVKEKMADVLKQQTDFNTNGFAQMKQLTDAIGGIINTIPSPKAATRKIGF